MRRLEILLLLMKNNIVTVNDLSKKFNVSKRTIQRDIDKLSIIGIPIISKRGGNGGIELDKHYMLSNIILTESEYKSVITALYILENIGENVDSISILKKLFMIDRHRLKELHDEVMEYFIVDLIDEKINIIENSNELVNYALKNKKIVIVYFQKKTYKVKPISYVIKNDGIYLYAQLIDKYVLIKVDEIDNIDILEENYDRNFIHYKNNKNINIIKKNN